MEKTQRREVHAVARARQNAAAATFRERFLAAPPAAQAALAPYLTTPFLRTVVATLCNDAAGGDLGRWAANPVVMDMLCAAKEAVDTGRITEAEAEHLLLTQAKVRKGGRRRERACAKHGAATPLDANRHASGS